MKTHGIMLPVYLLLLLLGSRPAHAQDGLTIKAYPELPAENLLRNPGFELMSTNTVRHLAEWSEWQRGSPWGFLVYPEGAATRDREVKRFGGASLRLDTGGEGQSPCLAQVVDGRDYTYKTPSAPGVDIGERLDDTLELGLDEDLLEGLERPSHILSCWVRSDGNVRGEVVLYNVAVPPARKRLASSEFDQTTWQKLELPFIAPEKGTALMVVLGVADGGSSAGSVWFDRVELLPVDVMLEYEVRRPGPAEVVVRDQASQAVLRTSTEKKGTLVVPADGVYQFEVRDRKGEALSRQYPEEWFITAGNAVVNGGFEQDPAVPAHWTTFPIHKWGPLRAPSDVCVDTNVFKTGRQSLSVRLGSMQEMLAQRVPADRFRAGRRYTFSFWAKTRGGGSYRMVLDRTRGGYLQYHYVGSCKDWRHYRFEFTAPEGAGDDLVVILLGPRSPPDTARLWLDDVAVRPLLQAERDAFDLLDGLDSDMTDFFCAEIRDRIYNVETALDMLRYDLHDFGSSGIIDADGCDALRRRLAAHEADWKSASDKLSAVLTDLREKKEDITARVAWTEVGGEGGQFGTWRADWREQAERLLSPVEAAAGELRNELVDERRRLVAVKAAADQRLTAGERAAFAGDYDKALAASRTGNPEVRVAAVLELGRLGDARAVPTLIEFLEDPSYPVRLHALYALAWMRSSQAVPAILSLLDESRDPWTRRRAAQALGQIGDARAAPRLQQLVERDDDGTVRQNAILSLGWMRDRSAVPLLTNIVAQCLREAPPTFEWLIRERALAEVWAETEEVDAAPEAPTLETLGQDDGSATDLAALLEPVEVPLAEPSAEASAAAAEMQVLEDENAVPGWKRNYALNNAYHTSVLAVQSLGLIGDLSVKPLLRTLVAEHGWMVRSAAIFGLGQMGDRADEPLLQSQTESRAGRGAVSREALNALSVIDAPEHDDAPGIRQPEFMKEKRYFYWLDNHFHRAFGRWFSEKNRPEDFGDAMRYAGAANANQIMDWKVPAPLSEGRRYFDAAHDNGLRCMVGELAEVGKAPIARKIHYYGELPAFAGIWLEEGPGMFLDDMAERARELDPDLLRRIRNPRVVAPELRWEHREFFARYAEILEENYVDGMREELEYLHMLRKGSLVGHYTSVCSSTFTPWPTIALWGRMAHNLDLNGTEPSYSTATYENAIFAEMCRDGGDVCTGMEIYIWRLPWSYTRRWEIGMGISLLHAQQFYVWYWGDIFKQFNSVQRGRPEAWDITRRMFGKMRTLEPYLVNNRRPKDLALVYSGRTSALLYRDDVRDERQEENAVQNLYTRNVIGIYQALAYEHTQCDVIWADTMTSESVNDYKVLILADAKTLTLDEEDVLREWVRGGGSLIVTGTSTLYDRNGRPRENYGLADVFGVDFVTNTCTIPLENIDSGRGVGERQVDAFEMYGGTVEYNVAYGYDRVRPTTAKVVSAWTNSGAAALTLNAFGDGHCLFVGATYPGAMYWGGRLIYRWTLFKHFHKGIRETLAATVRQGLTLAGAKPSLLVESCPWFVEANLRLQPDKGRILFQLLNYDEQQMPIEGVTARVLAPGAVWKVTYGADGQDIVFEQDGDYVTFPVRSFEIHEAVVIEYEGSNR